MPGYKLKGICFFIKAYIPALLFPKKNSLIVIQRINSNFIYANLLKLLVKVRQKHTVYDLDDADYLEQTPKSIFYFIKNCSVVLAGSNGLKANLGNLNKHVIVNTSPTPYLNIHKQQKNNILHIGWIGEFGGGHKESLSTFLFPALTDLQFAVKLTLIGVTNETEKNYIINYFKDCKHIELVIPENINWNDENLLQKMISEFDVGIATLLDTELQRCKSAFKAKQYLNNGVPVLSSNLPENNYFIEDNYNGYLCNTANEFKEKLIAFNTMSETEHKVFRENAIKSTKEFDLNSYCNTILRFYKENISRFPTH